MLSMGLVTNRQRMQKIACTPLCTSTHNGSEHTNCHLGPAIGVSNKARVAKAGVDIVDDHTSLRRGSKGGKLPNGEYL